MKKRDEISDPNSCLNKAADEEPIFVLRAKDPCAVAAILFWANLRVQLGIDSIASQKQVEATRLCNLISEWRERHGHETPP